MDLLGGYGSDDSSVASSSNNVDSNKKQVETKTAANSRKTKVGKRIISLAAVLPESIRNRLTQDQDDDDYSSSDEEPQHGPPSDKKTTSKTAARDEGLSNFLSELQSTSLASGLKPARKGDAQQESKMGASLVSSTVTVKGSTSNKTEKVGADEEIQSSAEHASYSTAATPKVHSAPAPASTANINRSNLPRPSRMVTTAPPRPSTQVRNASNFASIQSQGLPYEPDNLQRLSEDEATMNPRQAKKRQRQEMERALRSGQMDLEGLNNVASLNARDEYEAAVAESAAIAAAAGAQPPPSSHGIRRTTDHLTGKQRSKHQIHSLVASAIQLEQKRAREASVFGAQTTKARRATSKRKYGW